MTEPTDAEIIALCGSRQFSTIGAVREALRRWGTPPAVAGGAECTCPAKDMPTGACCKVRSAFEEWHDDQNDGRLKPFDAFKGGWIACQRASGTPQPTQTVPPAGREPLTEDQRSDIATAAAGFNWTDDYVEAIDYVIGAVESLHGTKGGQHGAE